MWLIIERTSLRVSNAPNKTPLPPPPTAPTVEHASAATSTEKHIDDILEAMPEFHDVLAEMVVTDPNATVHGGKYKCNHCIIIRRKMRDEEEVTEDGTKLLHCGCSQNKAVAEWMFKKKGLIGRVTNVRELMSLSEQEWFKFDHIMGGLIGYNTTWLLDDKALKAGLQAALDRL